MGSEAFRKVLSTLPVEQQNNYLELEHTIEVEDNGVDRTCWLNQKSSDTFSLKKRMSGRQTAGERRFRFGIVPMQLAAMLTDEDVKNRQHAIEEVWIQIQG